MRAGTAEGKQLLHAGLAHADEGELRGHEEAVGQDEEGHHDRAEEHPFQHSSLSLASSTEKRPAARWLPGVPSTYL